MSRSSKRLPIYFKLCPNCFIDLDFGQEFCPYCGTKGRYYQNLERYKIMHPEGGYNEVSH